MSGVNEVFYKCVSFIQLDQIIKVKPYKGDKRIKDKSQRDVVNKHNSFVLKVNKWNTYETKQMKFRQVGKAAFVLTIPQDEVELKAGIKEPIEWMTALQYLKAKKTFESFFDNFDRVNLGIQRIN